MKVAAWQIYSVLAFVLWGFWGFLPKIAVASINPKSVLIWEGLGFLIVTIALLFWPGMKLETNPRGVLISAVIGIIAILAELFYILALKQGKVSVVVSMTALYPLLTILLSLVLLKEHVTIKQIIGMIMAMGAVILLV